MKNYIPFLLILLALMLSALMLSACSEAQSVSNNARNMAIEAAPGVAKVNAMTTTEDTTTVGTAPLNDIAISVSADAMATSVNDCGTLNNTEAKHQAMNRWNIPHAQRPHRVWSQAVGEEYYVYDILKVVNDDIPIHSDHTNQIRVFIVVTHHSPDTHHPCPHWESGWVKSKDAIGVTAYDVHDFNISSNIEGVRAGLPNYEGRTKAKIVYGTGG